MQLDLSDAQELVRDTAVRFVQAEMPLSETRRFHDDPAGYDPGWLRKSAELGWYGLLVPEDLGGGCVSDHGLTDAVIVAEVLGAAGQPGPFLPLSVVTRAVAVGGSARLRDELLPRLIAGEDAASWACADPMGQFDGGAGVRVEERDGGLVVTGSRGFALEAPSAAHLLVSAQIDGAPVQVIVPTDAVGVHLTALHGLDLARRFAHVRLDGVPVPLDAVVDVDAGTLLNTALVLVAADTVGAMGTLFDMTVAYAKERIAFGRPIGSFQAIKHILADQAMYLEGSRAAADGAARALARGSDDAASAVHMAAAYIGDHGNELAQECLQVHGGIGFTWEHDLHLLLRRIRSNGSLFGEPTWHRERLCRLNGLGERR